MGSIPIKHHELVEACFKEAAEGNETLKERAYVAYNVLRINTDFKISYELIKAFAENNKLQEKYGNVCTIQEDTRKQFLEACYK